jgi:hypothetical protein
MQENVHDDISARNKIIKIAKQISVFLRTLNSDSFSTDGKPLRIETTTLTNNMTQEKATCYSLLIDVSRLTGTPDLPFLSIAYRVNNRTASYEAKHKIITLHVLKYEQWRRPYTMIDAVALAFDLHRGSFIHEMTHYYDNLRIKNFSNVTRSATYSIEDTPSEEEYYNHPIEFNAHYQGLMDVVDGLIKSKSRAYRKKMFPSFEDFYKALLVDPSIKSFFNNLNFKMRKHLRKRLYQYYQLRVGGGEKTEEKAVTTNDELFFLDPDETKQSQTSFEETKQFLRESIFINGHLIESGTQFRIVER